MTTTKTISDEAPNKPNVRITHKEILAIVHFSHLFEQYPGMGNYKEDVEAVGRFLDRVAAEGF